MPALSRTAFPIAGAGLRAHSGELGGNRTGSKGGAERSAEGAGLSPASSNWAAEGSSAPS